MRNERQDVNQKKVSKTTQDSVHWNSRETDVEKSNHVFLPKQSIIIVFGFPTFFSSTDMYCERSDDQIQTQGKFKNDF